MPEYTKVSGLYLSYKSLLLTIYIQNYEDYNILYQCFSIYIFLFSFACLFPCLSLCPPPPAPPLSPTHSLTLIAYTHTHTHIYRSLGLYIIYCIYCQMLYIRERRAHHNTHLHTHTILFSATTSPLVCLSVSHPSLCLCLSVSLFLPSSVYHL